MAHKQNNDVLQILLCKQDRRWNAEKPSATLDP